MEPEWESRIDAILADDHRYRVEAYHFVLDALTFTIRRSGQPGHVSAADLLAGIRDHGLEQFGPLTKTVFNHWGIDHSAQFGDIVFNLINAGLLGKRDEDQREDFDHAAFDLDTDLGDHGLEEQP
jgi:uncharacterized repeat protein (TIGR04138 family)